MTSTLISHDTGDGATDQLPEGLELAVLKMKVGETCEVAIQPRYAFGDAASKQPLAVVPPQATVIYTVELVSMTKVGLRHRAHLAELICLQMGRRKHMPYFIIVQYYTNISNV